MHVGMYTQTVGCRSKNRIIQGSRKRHRGTMILTVAQIGRWVGRSVSRGYVREGRKGRHSIQAGTFSSRGYR